MDMTQALAPTEAPAAVAPMMPTVPEPLPLMLTDPEPPPLMPVAPALVDTIALSGGPPVQPIAPPLLQMKRGEVLLKPEEARRKKAPKGYNYEPVLPDAQVVPQVPTDGKRVRRATSKAIEGEGGTIPQLGSAPKRQKANSFGQLPYGYDPPYAEEYGGGYGGYASYPSTSGTSGGDVDAKARKKEEKRRLLEELQRLREVQEKAERKQEKLALQRANRAAAAAQGGSLHGVDRHLVGAPQPYDTDYAPSTSQLNASGRPQRAAAAACNGQLFLNNQPDIEYNLDAPRAKRTVKANSLYTSDDLLTGEDIKLPPPELLPDTGPVERRRPERSAAPAAGTERLSPKELKERAVAKDRGFRMDRLFNHCCSVLRNVESRNKNAWLFAEPVDGKIVPDYHSVVSSPMDFSTMKKKVEQKEYDSPLQFVADARQVFTNCKLYNKPESAEAAMGLDVEQDFERRWMNSKIEEKWEQEMHRREQEEYDISVASDVRPPSPEPGSYAPAAMSSMRALAKGGSAPKRTVYSHTSTQREMTFDEKRALSTALESLPPEKLGRVVEIIQEANALGDEDKEELELDIDLLESATLWKLQRFVASVNTEKASAPAGDFSDIFAVADTLPQPSFGGSDSSSSSDEEE